MVAVTNNILDANILSTQTLSKRLFFIVELVIDAVIKLLFF